MPNAQGPGLCSTSVDKKDDHVCSMLVHVVCCNLIRVFFFSVVRKASAAMLGLKICTLIVQVEHLAALTETAASMELTCFTIISNSVIANNTSQQCRGCPARCSPWG
jgi:hypothetical protein